MANKFIIQVYRKHYNFIGININLNLLLEAYLYIHIFSKILTGSSSQLSEVHSQTLPAILYRPNLFGGNSSTGQVKTYPSSAVFSNGNFPCQMFAL